MPTVQLNYNTPISGAVKHGCIFEPRVVIDLTRGTISGAYRNLITDPSDPAYAAAAPEAKTTDFVVPLPADALGQIMDIVLAVATAGGATVPSVATVLSTVPPGVPPVIAVAIRDMTFTVGVGGTLQLQAIVAGSSNQQVMWVLLDADAGKIDDSGLYAAPTTPGMYRVAAISAADPSKCDVAVITVV